MTGAGINIKAFSNASHFSVPPAKEWVQSSVNKTIKTPTNKPLSKVTTNFMEDSDFLHLPKPSTKPISTPSLVKPPNSVSSQPLQAPATIRVTTKDSERNVVSPACKNIDPPDPLFVIGGRVKKTAAHDVPKNSVPIAADKRLVSRDLVLLRFSYDQ